MHHHTSIINHTMAIAGELTVDNHLVIEGAISAQKIETNNHTVVIGQYSSVQADVYGKQILVIGTLNGNIFATEKIDIRDTAVINGDCHAPLIKLDEKARLNGRLIYT